MNFYKDRDFKLAIGISFVILLLYVLNVPVVNFIFFKIEDLYNDVVYFRELYTQLTVYIIGFILTYTTIKVVRSQNIWVRVIAGFIYASITTYLVLYDLVLKSLYYVHLGGGDWGGLAIILGWPIYILLSAPISIFFVLNYFKQKDRVSKLLYFIMFLPTLCGYMLLYTVTLTGRMIFQPLYDRNINQIKRDVNVTPVSIDNQGDVIKPGIVLTVKRVSGSFEFSNNLSFPVKAILTTSVGDERCNFVNDTPPYIIRNGRERKNFQCDFIQDPTREVTNIYNLTYILSVVAQDNAAVKMEQTYSSKDFIERHNF